MAFYICVKGNITHYDFNYLEKNIQARINKTKVSHQKSGLDNETKHRINKEVYAIEIMSKNLQSIGPTESLTAAYDIMKTYNVHHLPILVDGNLSGLVSQTDLQNLNKNMFKDKRVHHIMSETILCASESTALRHIIEVFYKEKIRCLPIVDDHLFITGIVTLTDILKWIIDEKKYFKE